MVNRWFHIFFSLLLGILSLPHELGHYVFRKYYKVHTRGIVVGHPKGRHLFVIRMIHFKTVTSLTGSTGYGGAVMPRNAKRNFLNGYQQFFISLGGPLVDFIMGITLLTIFWVTKQPSFLVFSFLYSASSWVNLLPATSKDTSGKVTNLNDGKKMIKLSVSAWLACFLISTFLLIPNFILSVLTIEGFVNQ